MDEPDVICLLFVDGITLRVLPFVEISWEIRGDSGLCLCFRNTNYPGIIHKFHMN